MLLQESKTPLLGEHARSSENFLNLGARLSCTAKIILPGTGGWAGATQRWTEWCHPELALAVEVATENDVAETVCWANEVDRPFLAISGRHGNTSALRGVKGGVGIIMTRLDDLHLSDEGNTVIAGGGLLSGDFLKRLWTMGKVTVAGCCETTGVVAPFLGGGHGFLQGRYGLMADQLLSCRIVVADGRTVTASEAENEDLFWALRGAGHNFGIFTSFEYRVYDRIPEEDIWSYNIFAFKGEEVERVYEVANQMIGDDMPVELLHFVLMVNNPQADPDKPIVLFFILYQSAATPQHFLDPLLALSSLNHTTGTTDFMGLPKVAGLSASDAGSQPGKTCLRFPASTTKYDVPAMKSVYDVFASFPEKLKTHSIVITEAFSMHGVQAVHAESTAVPDRKNNLVMAAFVAYDPRAGEEKEADPEAVRLGKEIERLLGSVE